MENLNDIINSSESFDSDLLNYILTHKSKYKTLLKQTNEYNPYTTLHKYLVNSKNNLTQVKYFQRDNQGRRYAVGGLSLQFINRKIRCTISNKYYFDFDIENAHPVILEFLCIQNDFECPCLSEYIQNRESILTSLKMSRTKAKKTFLCIINDNNFDIKNINYTTDFLLNFVSEMKTIHNLFSALYNVEFKKFCKKTTKKINLKASFMNTLLCDFENKILMTMYDFFGRPKNCVLCFDGIMILKTDIKDCEYSLRSCEKYIQDELKIKVSLKNKKMDDILDIKISKVKKYIRPIIYDRHDDVIKIMMDNIYSGNITDVVLSQIFVKMVQDDVKLCDDGNEGYVWSYTNKLWEKIEFNRIMTLIYNDKYMILEAVSKCLIIIKNKFKDVEEKEDILEFKRLKCNCKVLSGKIQTTRSIKDMFFLASSHLIDMPFIKKVNRNHDFLPIKHGCTLNLKNGKVSERTRLDGFTLECPVSFIDEKQWSKTDSINLNNFVSKIYSEDKEYIEYKQIKMGSYLSGRCVRDIDVDHGCGSNGKSVIVNVLMTILNKFVGMIDKDVIVCQNGKSKYSGTSHTSHLIPIKGKRLIITQELKENDILNTDIVKKIASGDVIEGIREIYHRKTTNIYPFCKALICTNFVPGFNVKDMAILDRLNVCPYNSRFLNKTRLEEEKAKGLYDPSKFKYYEADISFISKYSEEGRHLDIFFSWLVLGCIKFYKTIKVGIKKPDIVKKYIKAQIEENDIIGQWLSEKCTLISVRDWKLMSSKNKKDYQTSSIELYTDFSVWAKDHECHIGYGKNKVYKYLNDIADKKRNKHGFLYHRICLNINNESQMSDSDDD